jgi:hypothetical protein
VAKVGRARKISVGSVHRKRRKAYFIEASFPGFRAPLSASVFGNGPPFGKKTADDAGSSGVQQIQGPFCLGVTGGIFRIGQCMAEETIILVVGEADQDIEIIIGL